MGALRYTLPTAPPTTTASLLAAPKAISAKMKPLNHKRGWRSW